MKKVYSIMFYTDDGKRINYKEIKTEEIQEEDYGIHSAYFDEYRFSSPLPSGTGVVRVSGTYFLCFDEDLKIRREIVNNIDWKSLEEDKLSILRKSMKSLLQEDFSDEKFNLFLINFGFL